MTRRRIRALSVLLWFGSTTAVWCTQDVPVAARVLLENSQVRISDIVGFKDQVILATVNGGVLASNSTGQSLWDFQLPFNAHIVGLHTQEGAVAARTADGSFFVVGDSGFTDVSPTGYPVVSACASITNDFLFCLTPSILFTQKGNSPLEPLYTVPQTTGTPTAILQLADGSFLLGTNSGWVYKLSAESDMLVVTDSAAVWYTSVDAMYKSGDGAIVSVLDRSFFVDTDLRIQPVLLPALAEEFAVPSSVRIKVSDLAPFSNGLVCVVVGNSNIAESKTRLAILNPALRILTLMPRIGSEEEMRQIECAGALEEVSFFAGNHGALLTVTGSTPEWSNRPTSFASGAWDAYTVANSEILMARVDSDSSLSWASSNDLSTSPPKVHRIAGISTSQIRSIHRMGDNVFIGMNFGFVIVDSGNTVVSQSGSIQDNVLAYSVDTSSALVWGCAGRTVSCWTTTGQFIARTIFDSSGVPVRLAAAKNGGVLIQDGNGKGSIHIVTLNGNDIHVAKLIEPYSVESSALCSVDGNTIYCTISSKKGIIQQFREYDATDFSLRRSIDIEQLNLRTGNIKLAREQKLLVQQERNLILLDLATSRVDSLSLLVPGEHPESKVVLKGTLGPNAVFEIGTEKIGLLDYQTTSVVEQDLIPHMYFEGVFPNPAKGLLTIKLGRLPTADPSSSELKIVDLTGNTVKKLDVPGSWGAKEFSFQITTDVADVTVGTYLLVVRNRGYRQARVLHIVR